MNMPSLDDLTRWLDSLACLPKDKFLHLLYHGRNDEFPDAFDAPLTLTDSRVQLGTLLYHLLDHLLRDNNFKRIHELLTYFICVNKTVQSWNSILVLKNDPTSKMHFLMIFCGALASAFSSDRSAQYTLETKSIIEQLVALLTILVETGKILITKKNAEEQIRSPIIYAGKPTTLMEFLATCNPVLFQNLTAALEASFKNAREPDAQDLAPHDTRRDSQVPPQPTSPETPRPPERRPTPSQAGGFQLRDRPPAARGHWFTGSRRAMEIKTDEGFVLIRHGTNTLRIPCIGSLITVRENDLKTFVPSEHREVSIGACTWLVFLETTDCTGLLLPAYPAKNQLDNLIYFVTAQRGRDTVIVCTELSLEEYMKRHSGDATAKFTRRFEELFGLASPAADQSRGLSLDHSVSGPPVDERVTTEVLSALVERLASCYSREAVIDILFKKYPQMDNRLDYSALTPGERFRLRRSVLFALQVRDAMNRSGIGIPLEDIFSTLENFKKTSTNPCIQRLINSWSQMITTSIDAYTSGNGAFLMLAGPAGQGKTHLAVGIASQLCELRNAYPLWFQEEVFSQSSHFDPQNTIRKVKEYIRQTPMGRPPVVIIDDCNKLGSNLTTALGFLLRWIATKKGLLVVTTNIKPDSILKAVAADAFPTNRGIQDKLRELFQVTHEMETAFEAATDSLQPQGRQAPSYRP